MKIARDFNANNYKIVSLTNGSSSNDAINFSQLQSANAITPTGGTFAVTGSGSFSSNLSVTGQVGIGGAIASNAMVSIVGQTPYVAGQNSVSFRINNQIAPENGTNGYGINAAPIFYNSNGFAFPVAAGINVPAMTLSGGLTGTITTSAGVRIFQPTIATNNYSLLLRAAASPGTVVGGLARWEDSIGTLIGGIDNYGQIYTTVASGNAATFQGGNVGIGTPSPHNTLHVQGDLFASNTVGMGNVYPTAGTVLSVSVPDQTVFPLRITQGTDPTKPVVTANAALNASGYYYIDGTAANKSTLGSVFGTGFFGYTSNITVGDSTSAPVSGAHNYPAWGGVTSFRPYLLVNNVSGILYDPTSPSVTLQDFAGESEHCLYAGVIEYHNGTINTNRTGRSWVGDMTSISATSPGSGLFGWGIQMIKRYAGSPMGITTLSGSYTPTVTWSDSAQDVRRGNTYDPSIAPNTTNTNNASAAFFATAANESMTGFGGSSLGPTYPTDIGYWAGGVSGSVASGRDTVGFNFGFLSGGHAGGYGGEFTQSLVGYGFASVEHTLAGIRLFQSTQNNYQSQTYAPLGIIVQANAGNSIFNASGGVYTAGNGYGPNYAYSYLQVGDNLPRTEYQSRNFMVNGGALSGTLNTQINIATFGVGSAGYVTSAYDTSSLSIKAIRNGSGSDSNSVAFGLMFDYLNTSSGGTPNANGLWVTRTGVGIGGGADVPLYALDVYGTSQSYNSINVGVLSGTTALTPTLTSPATVTVMDTNGSVGNGGALQIGAGNKLFAVIHGYYTDATGSGRGNIYFSTRNLSSDLSVTTRMMIQYDGAVGIGTVSPGYKLDVSGTGHFSSSVTNDANISVASSINSVVALNVGGNYQYSINANPAINPAANGGSYYGIQVNPSITIVSPNIASTYYGFYYAGLSKSGTGALTNAYGIYINAPTGASNNYSAYFANAVGIGNATPSYILDVTGDTRIVGDLYYTGKTHPTVSGGGGSAPTIATGGTISSSQEYSFITQSGNITGVILTAGTYDGQKVTVVNIGSFTVTFAAYATSHVQNGGGTGPTINNWTNKTFIWSTQGAAWYPSA